MCMKTSVYAAEPYANREHEVIPRETMGEAPSAELRPEQLDTDSLPPYEVLGPDSGGICGEVCSAEQIAEEQGVDVALVRSVLKLVEQSEYKRQQAAPVLKVTQKIVRNGAAVSHCGQGSGVIEVLRAKERQRRKVLLKISSLMLVGLATALAVTAAGAQTGTTGAGQTTPAAKALAATPATAIELAGSDEQGRSVSSGESEVLHGDDSDG